MGRGPEQGQGQGMPKKTPRPRPLSGAGRGKGPGARVFRGPVLPVTNSKAFPPVADSTSAIQRITFQVAHLKHISLHHPFRQPISTKQTPNLNQNQHLPSGPIAGDIHQPAHPAVDPNPSFPAIKYSRVRLTGDVDLYLLLAHSPSSKQNKKQNKHSHTRHITTPIRHHRPSKYTQAPSLFM